MAVDLRIEASNNLIKSAPKVSIIVPVYNVEKYAEQCFDSLLAQTLQDIEIILVDDGSTDSSGEICDKYAQKDDRVKVIHQDNKGLGLSRNSGMAIARGDYIGFVDSDDYVSEDMYRILYENAQKYNADISYCREKRFRTGDSITNNNEEYSCEIKIWSEGEIQQYLLDRIGLPPKEKNNVLYGASVWGGVFLRKRLVELGASFVSEREFISEDMLFDIDVIPYCKTIIHSDDELYYYRRNDDSLTTVYRDDRFEKDVKLYNEMCRRLGNIMDIGKYKNSTYRYLITLTRIAIMQEVQFYKQNGYKKAIANIRRICNNEQLVKALKDYDYIKLPFKYSSLCFLEKYKLNSLCFAECYLYEKFIKKSVS